jgi:quercetin dioxygenase-like cupin family protein
MEKLPMHAFDLLQEQGFRADRHVEKILARIEAGDVTVACWEPGQVSPYHAHPHATEIYFCFQGGGSMKTPEATILITPGSFVVHPPGELHEYTNGPERTLLFRVRYGKDMVSRHKAWPSNPTWKPRQEDLEYFAEADSR